MIMTQPIAHTRIIVKQILIQKKLVLKRLMVRKRLRKQRNSQREMAVLIYLHIEDIRKENSMRKRTAATNSVHRRNRRGVSYFCNIAGNRKCTVRPYLQMQGYQLRGYHPQYLNFMRNGTL